MVFRCLLLFLRLFGCFRGFQQLLSFASSFPWAVVGFLPLSTGSPVLLSVIYASVRVEGKFLDVVGGGGGPFPFKGDESSRRKRSFIRLSFREFRWWAVRFCFSKGEPLWVRTFRWGNRCLML